MKIALISIVFGVAGIAHASPFQAHAQAVKSFSATSMIPSVEAANRKGSHRVGGSGRSGKGGHYAGGRKR